MTGSAVVKRLTELGVSVLALCREGSAKSKNIIKSDLVKLDFCDLSELSQYEPEGKYDALFHFAWAGTMGGARDDVILQNKNVDGALAAFELAKRAGASLIVTAGSQAEYGVKNVTLRSDTPTDPITEYGKAKLKMCELVRKKADEAAMRHIHLRILSLYGIGDNENTMVMSAIRRMTRGEDTAFTDGEQVWDYLNSEDAARAICLLAEKAPSGVYPIGSGEKLKLKEYIKIIAEECGYEKPLGFGKIPGGENTPSFLSTDIEPLEKLGFEPEISFRQGIRDILTALEYRRT